MDPGKKEGMLQLGLFTPDGFFEAHFSGGAIDAILRELPVSFGNSTPTHAKIVGRWENEKGNGLVCTEDDDDDGPTHIHIISL
jgi:hypothetical protein